MPEITSSTPPQTKHVITAEEFIRAAKGEWFREWDWFYKGDKERILADISLSAVSGELKDEQEYIVVKYSTIALIPGFANTLLLLDRIENSGNRLAFIFFKCRVSAINIKESFTADWLFIHTHLNGPFLTQNGSQIGDVLISHNSGIGNVLANNDSRIGNIWIKNNSRSYHISIIDNSQSGNIWISDNSQIGDIRISGYSQSNEIWINGNSQIGDISIWDNSQSDGINVSRSSQNSNIGIWDNSQNYKIEISGDSQSGNISISSYSQNGNIEINDNSQVGNISIWNNSQSGDFNVSGNSRIGEISILENAQSGGLAIEDSHVNGIYIFDNYCSLQLINASVPLMKFTRCHLHTITWKAGTKGELYIEDSQINHLNLHKTALLKEAVIILTNVRVFILRLQDLLVQGQLICRNIQTVREPFAWMPGVKQYLVAKQTPVDETNAQQKTIYKSKCDLLEDQQMYYIREINELQRIYAEETLPLFRIVNSSLGKTEITGSDLTGFNIEYRDSKLLETFFSGTKLPKEKIKIYNPIPEQELPNLEYFEQKVGIYNQLKRIFDNQGDIVEATWYHSKAMDNQERLLKERHKQQGKKWFNEQWFDLLIFRLNKASNNNGESWRLAFRFIIVVSLVMYTLYYISLHYKEPFSFKATDRFVSNYFLFLDLTHKVDFHVEKKLLWWLPVFLDFVGRILIGYGIFQFIAAFRRHGRK